MQCHTFTSTHYTRISGRLSRPTLYNIVVDLPSFHILFHKYFYFYICISVFYVTGGGFTSQRGTFGSVAKLDTMLSITYGRLPQYAYSGGSTGAVYVWKGRVLERVVNVHQGPCFALHSLEKVRVAHQSFLLCNISEYRLLLFVLTINSLYDFMWFWFSLTCSRCN